MGRLDVRQLASLTHAPPRNMIREEARAIIRMHTEDQQVPVAGHSAPAEARESGCCAQCPEVDGYIRKDLCPMLQWALGALPLTEVGRTAP